MSCIAPAPVVECDEDRLRRVEAASLRVASSRRNGVVSDRAALDRLDAALEGAPLERVSCTVDLSAEQLAYLWRVISNDVSDATALIRSRSFSQYGPVESESMHNNVRVGSTLLGLLPAPASQSPDNQE